jgi:hypothetical protein
MGPAAAATIDYPSMRFKSSAAFVPPKPKEFDSA